MDVAQRLARPAWSGPDVSGDHVSPSRDWRPPIVKTIALRGNGIPELVQAIAAHRRHLETTRELDRRNRTRLANELEHILRDELMNQLLARVDPSTLADLMRQVADRRVDPYEAAERLIIELNSPARPRPISMPRD
jgi:LAO/AO transport system kinase